MKLCILCTFLLAEDRMAAVLSIVLGKFHLEKVGGTLCAKPMATRTISMTKQQVNKLQGE